MFFLLFWFSLFLFSFPRLLSSFSLAQALRVPLGLCVGAGVFAVVVGLSVCVPRAVGVSVLCVGGWSVLGGLVEAVSRFFYDGMHP